MKNFLSRLAYSAFLFCALGVMVGCVSINEKTIDALAKDPASFYGSVDTLYGKVRIIRTAANTNSMPHKITPEGTIEAGATQNLLQFQQSLIERLLQQQQPKEKEE